MPGPVALLSFHHVAEVAGGLSSLPVPTGLSRFAAMIARPELLAAIADGRDRLVESARSAGPDAVVPSCRRWTVRDLVVHCGNVHAWAASVLRTGVEQPQVFDAEPAGVGGFDELLFWYAGRAGDLMGLLLGDQVPDGASVWTFGPEGSTAAFWPRRQAHEITMHAVDAALAAGGSVADALLWLDPHRAADGVDEVLTVMLPRVALFVPRPSLPGRLALVARDTEDQWLLEPDGQIDSVATGSEIAARLVGPAAALFALLWRRAFLDVDGADLGVSVEGERAVVGALFAARLTP
jgi:uncharacterized protein (TIGR03083 family)